MRVCHRNVKFDPSKALTIRRALLLAFPVLYTSGLLPWIVHLNFQIDVLHAPTPKFPKYSPQQGRRDSAPTRQWMDNQVFDEGTGPALGDSDNVLPLIDREETKVGVKLVVISKAGPPLFKCSNVASALSVADLK